MADIFSKWVIGLDKTRKVTFGRISNLLGTSEINTETWDDLEANLFQADMGVDTTILIINALKEIVNHEGLTKASDLIIHLKQILSDLIQETPEKNLPPPTPHVILMVGVNGSGKTTTTAKLAMMFKNNGNTVLLGAADTYRAAATEQLLVWGKRINVPVISGQPGGDSAAVAYDAIQSGISQKIDIVIIDTAGRLHTRYNLMEELKKICRVAGKALPGAPSATWLILDATTGQNALQQAKAFKEAVKVDGIILTKLDSSARGGFTFAIQNELDIPILYAGLGETPEDLLPFDKEAFIEGILK